MLELFVFAITVSIAHCGEDASTPPWNAACDQVAADQCTDTTCGGLTASTYGDDLQFGDDNQNYPCTIWI